MQVLNILENPQYDKTHKITCAPSEDSDQPAHVRSLIRCFAVRLENAQVLKATHKAHSEDVDQT